MMLVDTSCWTHTLRRKGDPSIRARVNALLAMNQAAWCDVVRLELWNGATNDTDRHLLEQLEKSLPSLPITKDVWDCACILGHRARTSGLNVPATDLIIFSCAKVHGLRCEHEDRHYQMLETLDQQP